MESLKVIQKKVKMSNHDLLTHGQNKPEEADNYSAKNKDLQDHVHLVMDSYRSIDKKLAESANLLIHKDKLSSLGEVVAEIIHEISQPLNAAKLVIYSLKKIINGKQINQENIQRELQIIMNQMDRMNKIVMHVKQFSRFSSYPALRHININEIITNSLMLYRQSLMKENIKIKSDLKDNLPLLTGDPIRLEQVFVNLINNARHAVNKGNKKNKQISIKTWQDNSNKSVIVEIMDNGTGIQKKIKDKLFTPFFTTKAPDHGTGLGLSISLKIISDHKGKIEVDSEPGKWTRFQIILPAS